jgi:prepilin signal peptidase PulO-like enzyme (type II secretory pathway)
MNNEWNGLTPTCTISGTLLTLIFNMDIHDLEKTILLAAIGSVVSFGVSVLLKWGMGLVRRKV